MSLKEVLFLYGFSAAEAKSFSGENRRVVHFPPKSAESLDFISPDEMLKRIAWETLFSTLHVVFSPGLTKKEQEEGERAIERLQHFQRGAQGVLADVRDMGVKITDNIVRNLALLPTGSIFSTFLHAFRDVPAIICGAGPSLEKALPFLTDLRQRALVMAGGSALNALTHASISPHFAAAIDPDPPSHLFRQQGAVEAPLFYQNRVAHQLIKNCHGPRIWVPDNVTYPVEEWLMDRLGMETFKFEAGWNVVTFSLQLAVAMGCNPIIIAGVDLCHPDGKTYASGVSMPAGSFTPVPLKSGKETKADFLLAAEWIEAFVASYPEIKFINASVGGLSLKGMESTSLEEFKPQLPLLPYDIEGKIYSLLHRKETFLPSSVDIAEVVKLFKENIASCLVCIERMVALLQKWYPHDPASKGEFILLEVELEENPLYTYMLQPLWNVWQWALDAQEINEPYKGFSLCMQKLLFFQKTLREMQGI